MRTEAVPRGLNYAADRTAATDDAQQVIDSGPGRAPADAPSGLARVQLLAALGMGTVLVSYGLMAPIGALAVRGAGRALSVDAAFALAAPLWLAAHQVPLRIGGAPLGVLPLLPTAALGALIAAAAALAARRLGGRSPADAGPVAATVAGAHGMAAVLVSAVLPAEGGVEVSAWAALLGGALTAGAAATLGALWACGAPTAWPRAPTWLRAGLGAAGVGLAGLAACSATLLLASLALSADQVRGMIAAGGDTGGAVGLTVLSVSYLPNALGAAMSWMVGPGFGIGSASATVFGVTGGPLPGLPLAAAMPLQAPASWAPMVFLLPAAVGMVVGFRCRWAGGPVERLLAVVAAAVAVGCGVAVLAALSGGRLAGGPFDPVSVPAWAAGAAAAGWIALPGAAAGLAGGRSRRAGRVTPPGGAGLLAWFVGVRPPGGSRVSGP